MARYTNPAVPSHPTCRSLAVTIPILDFSVCFVDPTSFVWGEVIAILQITHGAVMCILAIGKFVRESHEMYRATKQWKLNQYMGLLVKQGIFYFLVYVLSHAFPPCPPLPPGLANKPITNRTIRYSNLLFSLINVLVVLGNLPTGESQLIAIAVLQYVPIFTLTPRFIMSIRELHARDVQGRRGGGIDTGFGLSSSNPGAGGMEITFSDVGRIELEDVEEIQMEVGPTDLK